MSEPLDISHLMLRSQQTSRSAQQIRSTVHGPTEDLDSVCRDFESLFLGYMMQQMRQTVPQEGLFSGGRAEEMYTTMLDNEISKSAAKEKSMGLAPMLYRQLNALIPAEKK